MKLRRMIVDLSGIERGKARLAAHRFVEATGSAKSLTAPAPRKASIGARALRLERVRTRAKVKATKTMRAAILGVLDGWRDAVIAALDSKKTREADLSTLQAEIAAALDSSTISDAQKQQISDDLIAALNAMTAADFAAAISKIQADLFQAGVDSGMQELGISWDLPPTNALAALDTQTLSFASDVVNREVAAIRAALHDGIEAGDSIPDLSERIQNVFDDGIHITDDGDKIVRVIPNDSWAEMVARTETSRAMNAGVMRTYRAAGVERIQWVAAEDDRTCPECDELDGEIVKLGEEFEGGVDAPPLHPSCRCTTVSAGFVEEDESDQDQAA